MIFEVNGIKLNIPEDLIKERKEIFFFDTEEEKYGINHYNI